MAGLARGSELELHLLVVDQVGQMVRRCDQAMRLAVTNVNPPSRTTSVLLRFGSNSVCMTFFTTHDYLDGFQDDNRQFEEGLLLLK